MAVETVDEFPVTNKDKKGSAGEVGNAAQSPWSMYGDFFHKLFSGGVDQIGPPRTYPLQAGGQDVQSMPGAPDRAPPVMAGQAPPLPPQAPPAPDLPPDPVSGAQPLIPEQPQLPPPQNPGQQDNQAPGPNPMLAMMMAMGRDGLVSAPAQAGQAPLDVNADTVMNKTSRPPPKKVKKGKAAKGDWTAHIED